MNKIFKAVREPKWFIDTVIHKYPGMFSDKLFLKLKYWVIFGKKLNLKNPKTFNEKIQWIKLFDRNPEYPKMVDKAAAKEYVTNIIGQECIIPTYGVWDKFEDIDFNSLPKQFVLKCTHDSGGLVICKDKAKLDLVAAKSIINKSLKHNFYNLWREWAYKNVKPRIIAEKYMADNLDEDSGLTDYKFFCCNGIVHNVMVTIDRDKGSPKFYFFNKEWEFLNLNEQAEGENMEEFTLQKPNNISQMFSIASKLSVGVPFVRVDLYNIDESIYFGELTLYPDAGFDSKIFSETDKLFGDLINLKIYKK